MGCGGRSRLDRWSWLLSGRQLFTLDRSQRSQQVVHLFLGDEPLVLQFMQSVRRLAHCFPP